jgi:transcriptional regulator GlxA family with amidase domain
MAASLNIAMVIYPGFEAVDLNGPLDVFIKANRYNQDRYRIYTVAEAAAEVPGESAVVRIVPDFSLGGAPPPDLVVLPGQVMPAGSSPAYGSGSPALIDWLKAVADRPETTIMSVCVGAYILAHTGLLDSRRATTHWLALSDMQGQYPRTEWVKNVRYVADGPFVTTGGVTSGIDGALYLVEQWDGADIAQTVADILVYNRNAPLPPDTILP